MPISNYRWPSTIVAAGISAGLAGYIFLVDPNKPASVYPQCPLKQWTGIDCPGCGGLRATHSLLHGDIRGAIDHNLLAFVILPVFAYFVLKWVLSLWGKEMPALLLPRWTTWAFPAVVVAFTVLRNVPSSPFYYFNSAIA